MESDYSNQKKMIAKMQRENKLEKLSGFFKKPEVMATIVGTLSAIAVVTAISYYSSKTIKPEVYQATTQIEERLDYEQKVDDFLEERYKKNKP